MKVLHISDLHLKKKDSKSIDTIIRNLGHESFDICLITGDLVDKFNYSISQAYSFIEDKVTNDLGVKHLFICCGNHDINRKKAMPMFVKHIDSLTTQDEIDNFVNDDVSCQFSSNLSHIEEFNKVVKEKTDPLIYDDLYAIYEVCIDEKQVCIVSLNMAWSAFSETSKGKIIYPLSKIEEINNHIKSCDFSIALSHYSLDFLSSVCRKQLVKSIHKTFDCLICGHSHEHTLDIFQYSKAGILACVAPSSIGSKINNSGYVKIDIDLNSYTAKIINSFYKMDHYIDDNEIILEIPTNEQKKIELTFHQHIISKRENILNLSSQLFVPIKEQDSLNFLDIFIDPVISDKNETGDIILHENKVIKSKKIQISDLSDDKNYLIYGKDKSGKTALLYKLMLDNLAKFYQSSTIPIYIDLKGKNETYRFNIDNEIKNQYNLSKVLYDKVKDFYKVRILIDNLDPANKKQVNNLFSELENSSRTTFIALSNNVVKASPLILDGHEYEELYLTDISRSKIRELTYKWPIKKQQNPDEIVEKITKLFTQLHIHCNFWTVTMFLTILDKTDNIKLHSLTDLINLYVENILDRQKLSLDVTRTFQYDDYLDFLSNLAYFLYKEKETNNYCSTYEEIVRCFEEYKKPFPRLIATSYDIINYILNQGIIFKLDNNCFTFRLNGVFEYFLAYYLKNHIEILKSVLKNNEVYLSFKNELEIYAGFVRDDDEMLMQVFINTLEASKIIQNLIVREIDYEETIKDNNLNLKPLLEIASEIKDEIKPISYSEQDEIKDDFNPISQIESKITVKKKYNIENIDSNIYSEHLFILGRVFKNLDRIQDESIIKEVFKFMVDQSCMLIYYLIHDLFEYVKKEAPSISEAGELSSNINTFSPLLAHSFLFDSINHPSLSNLIKEEIESLKINPEQNQFKLYVLYFLLIDTNLEEEIDQVKNLIEVATFWNIQYSIFIKLLLIIAFKSNDNYTLQSKLRKYVEMIHKKMYPGRDRRNKPISNRGVVNKIIENIKQ